MRLTFKQTLTAHCILQVLERQIDKRLSDDGNAQSMLVHLQTLTDAYTSPSAKKSAAFLKFLEGISTATKLSLQEVKNNFEELAFFIKNMQYIRYALQLCDQPQIIQIALYFRGYAKFVQINFEHFDPDYIQSLWETQPSMDAEKDQNGERQPEEQADDPPPGDLLNSLPTVQPVEFNYEQQRSRSPSTENNAGSDIPPSSQAGGKRSSPSCEENGSLQMPKRHKGDQQGLQGQPARKDPRLVSLN